MAAPPSPSVVLNKPFSLIPKTKTQSLSLTSTCHHSRSTFPKMPHAVSDKTSLSAIDSSCNKKETGPVVVIDNYDSFSYNLCQYMGEMKCDFEVFRNDELSVDELKG